CVLDAVNVIGVTDTQDIPPVSQKSRFDVLGKSDSRIPLDSDVVVVVDPANVVEGKVTGQRRRFRSNSLHQASISANGINIVVENLKPRPFIPFREPLLGNAHSYARRNALPEWTGRCFNA